jgi:hypothetical protein
MARLGGVLFLLGDDDAQIANHLSREFALGFEQAGVSAQCLRASELTRFADLEAAVRAGNTRLVISLSGLGMDMRGDGNVYQRLGLDVLLMLLDHPILYWDKVEVPSGLSAVSTLSEADADFVSTFGTRGRPAFQLAHAANAKARRPWAEKSIPVFYCGTLRASPAAQRGTWAAHGERVAGQLNAIVEEHLGDGGRSLMAAATRVLAGAVDCADPLQLHPYYVTVDAYLRDYHRVETLKSLRSVPVVLAGGGWEAVLGDLGDNVEYLGRIHPDEVRARNGAAKIVLNVINTYHESHERVFSTIADGGVSLTSTSAFYESAFTDEEVLRFDWNVPDLNATVAGLLAEDARLQAIAAAGHAKFLAAHTWRHRAEKIVGNV